VDTDAFRPAPGAAPGPEEGAPCRLLLAGTHQAPYRGRSALECLAALAARGFAARLTGAGRCHWPGGAEEAARDARELGVEGLVTFAPPYRQEDAPALYRAHKSCCIPIQRPVPHGAHRGHGLRAAGGGLAQRGAARTAGREGGVLLPVPEDDYERDHAPEAGAMARAVEALAPRLGGLRRGGPGTGRGALFGHGLGGRHEDIFCRVLGGAAPNARGVPGARKTGRPAMTAHTVRPPPPRQRAYGGVQRRAHVQASLGPS
jgi:hypothetical protein